MEETLFLKRESKLSKFKISDDIYYQEEKKMLKNTPAGY